MGSGCAGPYKPGIVDSFRNQSFSGSMFNLGSATSRCKSWWFNGNRTQPSEFLSRIQKWEIYIAFFASKCVFFLQGGFTLVPWGEAMNFFRWWMGYPQFLRSLPKHDGIFFLVTSRKNCQRFVYFLLPGLNQQQVKHGCPKYMLILFERSLLFGKNQTHIFSFGQSTMFPRNQHRQLRNRDADGWSSTYSICNDVRKNILISIW